MRLRSGWRLAALAALALLLTAGAQAPPSTEAAASPTLTEGKPAASGCSAHLLIIELAVLWLWNASLRQDRGFHLESLPPHPLVQSQLCCACASRFLTPTFSWTGTGRGGNREMTCITAIGPALPAIRDSASPTCERWPAQLCPCGCAGLSLAGWMAGRPGCRLAGWLRHQTFSPAASDRIVVAARLTALNALIGGCQQWGGSPSTEIINTPNTCLLCWRTLSCMLCCGADGCRFRLNRGSICR